MKRVFVLTVAFTFFAPALRAQSFYGVLTFRTAFGFSMEVLAGGGLSFFNDRVNLQIEGGYFMSAAGPEGATFPMTGALIYFEPMRLKGGSGVEIGGGIRAANPGYFMLAPAAGIRYRGQTWNDHTNQYAELDAIIGTRGGVLPRVGVSVRRMIPY